MLHILLLIIKIIGIILAAILGILVLLVCIVLFVPVRYEIMGKGDVSAASLKSKIRITWLLHLVAVDIYYTLSHSASSEGACITGCPDGYTLSRSASSEGACITGCPDGHKTQRLRWKFRAAWIKKAGGQGSTPEKIPAAEENVAEDDKSVPLMNAEDNDVAIEKGEETQRYEKNEERYPEALEREKTVYEESEEFKETREDEKDASEERKGIGEKVQRVYQKITAWFQKIKCTFSTLCDKIKALLEKKDKIAEFIEDEVHVDAFVRVKKELFRYLKRLNPKKADVKLVYGFEDPYRTGQVLAGLSILYPFIGEYTSITPDFEHRVFKGSAYIKGKLYMWHIADMLLRLILSKNIRTTYRHIKNFEL